MKLNKYEKKECQDIIKANLIGNKRVEICYADSTLWYNITDSSDSDSCVFFDFEQISKKDNSKKEFKKICDEFNDDVKNGVIYYD